VIGERCSVPAFPDGLNRHKTPELGGTGAADVVNLGGFFGGRRPTLARRLTYNHIGERRGVPRSAHHAARPFADALCGDVSRSPVLWRSDSARRVARTAEGEARYERLTSGRALL